MPLVNMKPLLRDAMDNGYAVAAFNLVDYGTTKAMVQAAEGKNVWLVGGGDLVGQFHDQGRLDEVIIGMASVFLGSGAPLLPRRIVTPPLQLLEVTKFGADFAMLRYAVQKD